MNRNSRLFNTRYQQIVVVCVLLMFILCVRLFVVTVLQHDRWTDEASEQNTKAVYTSAPRGNIYDRNGNVLATSKQVFTVNFNASALETEEINESALILINTLIKNGDKYTDKFPIKIRKNGTFYYTYDQEIKNWLKEEGFSTDLSADKAFKALRAKYNIAKTLDRYDAMEVLQEKYNLDPPISVKKMEYTQEQERTLFLGKFGFTETEIKKGISAEKCFKTLRKNYSIDKKLPDREARKIFIIRNEIATNGFTRYLPIKVASGIGKKTIAYLEEANLPGIEISSESERYYPNGSTACHILGYMGAISESETEYYVEKRGYSASDLVGKDGIEAALESKLHGTAGTKKIRVNSSGQYVQTISETEAKKGSDVYLSIDLDLQKAAEKSLAANIKSNSSSQSGAVVALDVKTGDVLAMASYPNYDPNIFAKGITTKAWKSVQAKNARDVFSPAPLYNNATRAAIQPGSTFKPATALAALGQGLNPNQSILDVGHIELGGRTFGCDNWNQGFGTHGSETLEAGIGNSCNYYFYCIGTGKDWGTGNSLGYKISVDDILNTAKKLGLGQSTGIELDEVVAPLPSAEAKLATTELGVREYLYNNAHTYFPEKIANDKEKLKENLYTIASWTKDNPDYGEIVELLREKTDVKEAYIDQVASDIKFNYFIQAEWSTGDQFNISIGQGDNAYTPLQMARYLATIGNKGKRNDVSVVSAVEGEGANVKKKAAQIKGISEHSFDEVLAGMRRVCSMGTLAGFFGNYPVEVVGKTGTAENQAIKQPKSEVAYIKNNLSSFNSAAGTSVTWSKVMKIMEELMESDSENYPTKDSAVDEAVRKASKYKITMDMINSKKGSYEDFAWTMAMAPADDPQIAVVVMLVEGGYSYHAAPVAKDVVSAYLNLNEKADKTGLTYNTIGKNERN
ncbi:MAG: penicillin-binding transpeptidase domain-containing protein [Clostridia bacterium]|nr:penicillin-binding transpeptidase domain-containing protein [Clostridia bacterium]